MLILSLNPDIVYIYIFVRKGFPSQENYSLIDCPPCLGDPNCVAYPTLVAGEMVNFYEIHEPKISVLNL